MVRDCCDYGSDERENVIATKEVFKIQSKNLENGIKERGIAFVIHKLYPARPDMHKDLAQPLASLNLKANRS